MDTDTKYGICLTVTEWRQILSSLVLSHPAHAGDLREIDAIHAKIWDSLGKLEGENLRTKDHG